jgi:cell division transport system ATP-binding protein
MDLPMIQMFHVSKSYASAPPCLTDVTLQIDKGEFVFITGPSGAGKSTLLKLMFCAERATSGQVLVEGRNLGRIRNSAIPFLRRNVGVVFQDFKLLTHRTVSENVAFPLQVLGVSRVECEERVRKMLRRVGLAHKTDSLPPRLSGGEQQRVVIARALVNEPTILLADEPTGNLDPELTVEILDLLCDFNVRGTTVVVATHDASVLARYRKRIIRLQGGLVVFDGNELKGRVLMAAG